MTHLVDLSQAALGGFGDVYGELGAVTEVADGVVFCSGLLKARLNEVVLIDGTHRGVVVLLTEDFVGIGVMARGRDTVREGSTVELTGELFTATVSGDIAGRVLDCSGTPVDGGRRLAGTVGRAAFAEPPELSAIARVDRPLETGIVAIDAVTPIGKGQRQQILGDRATGKTQLVMDIIVNQRGKRVRCLYVALGSRISEVSALCDQLRVRGAMEYTTVVLAPADASLAEIYLAPYYAAALAEQLRDAGEDVLLVFDDLTAHADAYRSIALLLRRTPGREAYPGDVFYLHGSLLERGAQMTEEKGGGSITMLALVDTLSGDVTGYIASNVMSITDGQIVLSSTLANEGQMPPIDLGPSVSRIGRDAQYPVVARLTGGLRRVLAAYEDLKPMLMYDNALSAHQRHQVAQARAIRAVLAQRAWQPVRLGELVVLLWALQQGVLAALPAWDMTVMRDLLVKVANESEDYPDFEDSIRQIDELAEPHLEFLRGVVEAARARLG
ncbi:F0F1 ATP synthase subunit alpha [Cellulomonas soli]|uniref:F0F1 ATP synthase subunit alpha n=1 Tax=Cellulomonas soli TaxID=931535 RepID=UPI003F835CFB